MPASVSTKTFMDPNHPADAHHRVSSICPAHWSPPFQPCRDITPLPTANLNAPRHLHTTVAPLGSLENPLIMALIALEPSRTQLNAGMN